MMILRQALLLLVLSLVGERPLPPASPPPRHQHRHVLTGRNLLLDTAAHVQWGASADAEPAARPAAGAAGSPTRPLQQQQQQQQQQQRVADVADQPGASPRASSHLEHHGHEHAAGHDCGHSLVAHLQEHSVREFQLHHAPAARAKPPPSASRLLSQYAAPGTIRINVQYQLSSQLSSSQQQAVQRVMDTAVRVLKKFVKITAPLQAALQVRTTAVCSPATVPSSLRAGPGKGLPSTDFVLLVTSQQSSSCPQASSSTAAAGALAWAMACDYSLDSASFGRPILAVMNLCSGALSAVYAAAADPAAVSGSVVDVLVHELMHALGLSSSMYSTWSGASGGGVSTSNGVSYLSTANARQAAQSLLACSQLPGVPLEDQGSTASANSHWEYRYFNQELMSPYLLHSSQRQRLTKLTLGALQDTGWYSTRSSYAQRLDLEQLPSYSLGCSMALSSCQAFQSQSPGAYYCASPGSDSTSIKAPAQGTKQSPAPGTNPASASPTLQCFTPSTPAACDSTPYSNGCGVLRASPVSCSATNFASFIPSGTVNQMSGISGVSTDASFYQGLGAYYGAGGSCLTWFNSSGSSFAGCFDTPRCSNGSPTVLAVVSKAVVSIPCAPASSVLLSAFVPVKDTGTSLACPSPSQAASICSPPATGYCRNGGACSKGTCAPEGTCICDLEYMGASCSVHVSQVTDFDSLSANAIASIQAAAVASSQTAAAAAGSQAAAVASNQTAAVAGNQTAAVATVSGSQTQAVKAALAKGAVRLVATSDLQLSAEASPLTAGPALINDVDSTEIALAAPVDRG